MTDVFISSLARGELGGIRARARAAVDSLQMRPVMFETQPAGAEDSRRLLLDRLARCDVMVLMLGSEYGEPGQRGTSPTEEEFDHANANGIPVLVLVQEGVTRSPEQEAFVSRVRGDWEQGNFTGRFQNANDVGFAVVAALNDWRQRSAHAGSDETRRQRALDLAQDHQRGGGFGGSRLRVVLVPATDRTLLDAITLGDGSVADDLGMALRTSRLVGNQFGLTTEVRDRHFVFEAEGRAFESPRAIVGPDGAIVGETSVAGDGMLGGSVVEGPRVGSVYEQVAQFAQLAWQRIDQRDEVREVLVVTAVPEPSQKVFAEQSFSGNSLRMGGMNAPPVLLAPAQPFLLRRADLTSAATAQRVVAEVRQAFADLESLH